MSTALFDLDDFEETKAEWVVVGDWDLCGLCGTRVSGMNQGGTLTGNVCDACASIDGCRIREHEAVVCRNTMSGVVGRRVARCLHCGWWLGESRWEDGDRVALTVEEVAEAILNHVRPRHTSHWGYTHEVADHDRLVAAQAKRRAAYLRRAVA